MIQRRMSLDHPMGLNDVRRVVESIKDIGEGEELVIQMSSQDSFRAEGIFSVLDTGDYRWSAKGGHDGKDYYIVARKR
ncbi:hypothetical protein [Lutispora saccharofermentans]|uniref:Uncharacterized protein n=1 Tax=Lutispora saccharofermentans TaxID=3024236 RepID=A0ABT1NI88_9FIRM|nr:hypothetical protein [Lutispora saccharofermentans]MCQ1530980.1 hypothetical protein [Lutispora saccharofermentans]